MRRDILEAGIRVLAEEGADSFTTIRVAERAGVSVGSLYQYFPSKQSILLALHAVDVENGWKRVANVLDEPHMSEREKVGAIARWFFSKEAEEVVQTGHHFGELENMLSDDAETFVPENLTSTIAAFILQGTTQSLTESRAHELAQLFHVTIISVGKNVARMKLSPENVRTLADDVATMLSNLAGFPPDHDCAETSTTDDGDV